MPAKKTIEKARQNAREGKAATTQAGEFVREEIEDIREGKHGARSIKQAIAIGLSKARRAGVKLPPPAEDKLPSGPVSRPSAITGKDKPNRLPNLLPSARAPRWRLSSARTVPSHRSMPYRGSPGRPPASAASRNFRLSQTDAAF